MDGRSLQPLGSAYQAILGHTRGWATGYRWQAAFVAVSVVITLLTGMYRGGAGPIVLHLAASCWLSGVTALMVLDAFRSEPSPRPALSWLAWSMVPVVVAVQLTSFGADLPRWDLLWAPASIAMVIGWSLAKGMPERLRRTLRRLWDREVLSGGPDGADYLSRQLDRSARRWAWIIGTGAFVAFAVTGPWTALGIGGLRGPSIWLGPFGAAYLVPILLGVVVVGAWLGRVAAYGRLGVVVRKHGVRLRLVPDHPDGAGGLQPIGAYFLHQSLLAAIPPIYMILWLVIFALTGGEGLASRYQPYAIQFRLLLPMAIMLEISAFLVPMYSIHTIMRTQKETTLCSESDQVSLRIEEIRGQLAKSTSENHGTHEAVLSVLIRRFEALERAPTWPIDASIRKRFTLRNLGLLLPLAGYAFENTPFWDNVAEILQG